MGLNAFLTGLANLDKIRRAPDFFKFTENTVFTPYSHRELTHLSLCKLLSWNGNLDFPDLIRIPLLNPV